MFIKLYLIALPIFLSTDIIWLTFIAKQFYSDNLGYLMSKNPNLLAAIIFYLIFLIGLVFFVILPSLQHRQLLQLIFSGALFGLVCYATYDLTNLATIQNWPVIVTLVDLLWGAFLSSFVATMTYLVAIKVGL